MERAEASTDHWIPVSGCVHSVKARQGSAIQDGVRVIRIGRGSGCTPKMET